VFLKRPDASSTKSTACEGNAVNDQRSVLIVDSSEENREVLQTILEHRGIGTRVVSHPIDGAALVQQDPPDLIVFDLDSVPVVQEDSSGEWLVNTSHPPVILFLGTLRRQCPRRPLGEFISKP
jgi:DNA-binding NtrC family response regulator